MKFYMINITTLHLKYKHCLQVRAQQPIDLVAELNITVQPQETYHAHVQVFPL